MSQFKIINCKQGSKKWYKSRFGNATASNFDKIITPTGKKSGQFYDYAFQLASELLVIEQDPSYCSEAMERGNEIEDFGRQAYINHFFLPVQEVGFMLCKGYGYSPDGLVGEKGQIEIKSPMQKEHTKYVFGADLPNKYKPQVQGGLLVSNREWCDFVSFHPNFPEPLDFFCHRIYRDEEYIAELKKLLAEITHLKLEILTKLRKQIKNKKIKK